jgi:hypothetical protein
MIQFDKENGRVRIGSRKTDPLGIKATYLNKST